MKLNNETFAFCKEVGLYKENTEKGAALEALKKCIREVKSVDPEFLKKVEALSLSDTSNVWTDVCVVYRYDVDLKYVINGLIKTTHIHDFGNAGAPSQLEVTRYYGDGVYTILKDVTTVKYPVWNEKNVFTLPEFKSALKDQIGKHLPTGWTSYETQNWEVSAYLVPVLIARVKHNGKDYDLYYNLHNKMMYYHWVNNPALIKRGKASAAIATACMILGSLTGAIGTIMGFTKGPNWICVLMGLVAMLANFFVVRKLKKDKAGYRDMYFKDPEKKLPIVLLPIFIVSGICLILGLVSMIIQ